MRASDLRIGNLIHVDKEVFIVDMNDSCGVLSIDKRGLVRLDNCTPILLTEKWFINFRFKLDEDEGDVKCYQKGRFCVKIVDDLDFYSCMKMYEGNEYWFLKHLTFVHELQNLYFALTGEELTLNQEV
jgi:hypothetical protein